MNDEDHRYEPAGSPLEVALLNFMVDNGIPIQDRFIQAHHQNEVKLKSPFCSLRKSMTVVHRLDNQTIRVVMKGAPEVLVPLSTRLLNANNQLQQFDGIGDEGDSYLAQVVSQKIAQ